MAQCKTGNSIADALELPQSCTEPSILWIYFKKHEISLHHLSYMFLWYWNSMGSYSHLSWKTRTCLCYHYNDVIMSMMTSQITSLMIVYSTIYSGTDQRKHQSALSLAFVQGIHRWLVNSPHKGPVMRKMFPLDDIMTVNSMDTDHLET